MISDPETPTAAWGAPQSKAASSQRICGESLETMRGEKERNKDGLALKNCYKYETILKPRISVGK